MRWLWILFLVTPAFGASPIYNDYPDKNSIYTEFRNVFDNMQDQMFTETTSTPSFLDLKEGQLYVYASTPTPTVATMFLRVGTTLYVSPNWNKVTGR